MIRIIGGGFSGLSLAYHFVKMGQTVVVIEKESHVGGIIQSRFQNDMLVESAANGFLASQKIEELFFDIGIKPIETKKASRKKFIFRGRLRRWPLNFLETLELLCRFVIATLTGTRKPKKKETLAQWSARTLGQVAGEYLIQPIVNGIFAQKIDRLDAGLVLGSMFNQKIRGRLKGLISAPLGMGEVIQKLQTYLSLRGVQFHFEKDESFDLNSLQHNTFIAINFSSFLNKIPIQQTHNLLLKKVAKSEVLHSISLVRATVTFKTINLKQTPEEIEGFGVLFPNAEKFNALGVLANTKIFEDRGCYNESWIFSDSTAPDLLHLTDKQIIEKIIEDRRRIFKSDFQIKDFVIHRWPNVIPIYNSELRDFLELNPLVTTHLTGNYLGVLGLTGIHERNFQLATEYLNRKAT